MIHESILDFRNVRGTDETSITTSGIDCELLTSRHLIPSLGSRNVASPYRTSLASATAWANDEAIHIIIKLTSAPYDAHETPRPTVDRFSAGSLWSALGHQGCCA